MEVNQQERLLHRDVQNRRRVAWAWGLSGSLPYLLLHTPYQFEGIIDGQVQGDGQIGTVAELPVFSADKLKELNPDSVLLVMFADAERYGEEIRIQVSDYGKFHIVEPYLPLKDDLPDLIEQRCIELLERLKQARSNISYIPTKRRIALWIHRLAKGGAERQMVLLACGLSRLGYQVDLICSLPDTTDVSHWNEELSLHNVNRLFLPSMRESWNIIENINAQNFKALEYAPHFTPIGLHHVLHTQSILEQRKPELVISFLDDGNIVSGIAGVLAGTPNILMSGRSVEPNNFPQKLYPIKKSQLRMIYRNLLSLSGIRLCNNSHAGSESYRSWLSLDNIEIPVIPNAIKKPDYNQSNSISARKQFGIEKSAPLVLGIMRLTEEKQPDAFIEVVNKLHKRLPKVRAILLGDGPLFVSLKHKIIELDLVECCFLAGFQIPYPFLNEADLLLSTSRIEGMPNVILEAQLMGCPVIATDVGGTAESMMPPMKMGLVPKDDWNAMVNQSLIWLSQPQQAKSYALDASRCILNERSVIKLAKAHLNHGVGVEKGMNTKL